MKQLLSALTLTASLSLLTYAGTAQAGTYVSVGLGADAELTGDLAANFATGQQTAAGRLSLGQSVGPLAVEASIFGTGLIGASPLMGDGEYNSVSAGVSVRYTFGLIGPVDGYARVGIDQSWIVSGSDMNADVGFSGRGRSVGGGLELSLKLPLGQAGVWADYNHQELTMAGDGGTLIGSARTVTLGLTVGL